MSSGPYIPQPYNANSLPLKDQADGTSVAVTIDSGDLFVGGVELAKIEDLSSYVLTSAMQAALTTVMAALSTSEPVTAGVLWLDGRHLALSAGIPPSITSQPSSVSNKIVGETASFSVTATNANSYQWQKQESGVGSWADVSGATSSSYTTSALVLADNSDAYRCNVTGAGGSTSSSSATITLAEVFRLDSGTGVTGSPVSAWLDQIQAFSLTASGSARPAIVSSVFGSQSGLLFDGAATILRRSGGLVSASSTGSIAVVFKTAATITGTQVLVSFADEATSNNWFEVGIDATGRLYVERNVGGSKRTANGSTFLAASTAYQLLMSYDGTDWHLRLSNTEENPIQFSNFAVGFGWLSSLTGTVNVSVGATYTSAGAARFFSGHIGSVRIYSKDLTR